jgi:hypothetical protein
VHPFNHNGSKRFSPEHGIETGASISPIDHEHPLHSLPVQRLDHSIRDQTQQPNREHTGSPDHISSHVLPFLTDSWPSSATKSIPQPFGQRETSPVDPSHRSHSSTGALPAQSSIIAPYDSRSEVQRPRTASDVASASSTVFTQASSGSRAIHVETYRYDPLGKMQIRLVKIQAVKGYKVKCEIFPASLESPPPYVAISYAWGDPDQRSAIVLEREIADEAGRVTLERTPYRVTTSLYGALEALRDKREEVFVWVDALCINQKNSHERTNQIEMMTDIYRKATSVAIWLGPEADGSDNALELLKDLKKEERARRRLSEMVTSRTASDDLQSLVALFEREYWDRLWIVQEVLNARSKSVYCGTATVPWDVFEIASRIFIEHKTALDGQQPDGLKDKRSRRVSHNHFTYSQVLVYQGPSSLPDVESLMMLEHPLLEVMRTCRRKLTAKPHDKVFGILGVLPEEIRREFMVDYDLSVKEVYIRVVDYILATTDRLDVIREAIHYPLHTGSMGLPSWCPDWSHIPDVKSLERSNDFPPFAASGQTRAVYKPLDEHRKLEISAIQLDKVKSRGISVGTLTTLSENMMAFLHWRAMFLNHFRIDAQDHEDLRHHAFCRSLCLDQIPGEFEELGDWQNACYHAFAALLRARLPQLPIDEGLMDYAATSGGVLPISPRPFLRRYFASHMMGRCFFITENGYLGLGTGFMAVGDIITVPYGCSTPIVLRPEGRHGEFRYVGDTYVDGFMMGEAVVQRKSGQLEERKYLLH